MSKGYVILFLRQYCQVHHGMDDYYDYEHPWIEPFRNAHEMRQSYIMRSNWHGVGFRMKATFKCPKPQSQIGMSVSGETSKYSPAQWQGKAELL